MRWKGNKKFKEVFTEDGYHLKAEYFNESKYWWIVYKNGKVLYRAVADSEFASSLQIAQAKAQQRMIKHLKSSMV
ncbi:hypothetical protein H2O64_00860 [Kordia sp. YSTF-M3]|uniref:DUF1508 domain-containing protein n=1 Tax=Kordia aestuariivivens TaxID=2759037 RepID=A0ABR7Q4D1_9FLAO|nr:hypothetical protein [Kordia aestuariivivens]MBC8753199.1 hypothetical protein [Kordia aestuariivivens]